MAQFASPIPAYQFAEACRRRGRIDLWRQAVACAFELPHDSPEEIFHRGNARLLLEDWSGWVDRETRILDPSAGYLESRHVLQLRYHTLAWDGRADITHKTIYVIADGDLGDVIRMLRYLPLLAARSGRVVLAVPPELIGLVRMAYGKLVTVALRGTEQTIPYDRYTWTLSLPALFGELPPFERLRVPSAASGDCGPAGPRVGICWGGAPKHPSDAERFCPPDLLTPLFSRGDIDWYQLQVDGAPNLEMSHPRLSCPVAPVYSLAQMATVLATLNGVVTVDTAIAHLAGALGIPTWVLLSAGADPRWGPGDTTPWYPTLRLLRQPTMGDWPGVLDTLTDEIETWRSR